MQTPSDASPSANDATNATQRDAEITVDSTGRREAEGPFITEPVDLGDGVDALKATVAGTTEATQATLLLKKRKDMRIVEDALESVKKQFKERMELLAERQLKFEEKQRALQEMVAKFKPFIEENDSKRVRATTKATSEAHSRSRLDQDIANASEELAAAKVDKEDIENEITRLRRYAWYLEEVVSSAVQGNLGVSESFESPGDILGRYTTLNITNQDLHKQASIATDGLEGLRTEVASLDKKMRDMALVATSGTQELRAKLESIRSEVTDLISQREFAEADVRRMRAIAGQTETSIKNILARVFATAPVNSLPKVSLDKSRTDGSFAHLCDALQVIGDRIEDLGAITDEYTAWKEQSFKEREAILRARSVAAGSGIAAVRASVGHRHEDSALGASAVTSQASFSLGSATNAKRPGGPHMSGTIGATGLNPTSTSSFDHLSTSQTGEGGAAAPSTTPGVFVVKVALPTLPSAHTNVNRPSMRLSATAAPHSSSQILVPSTAKQQLKR